MHRAAVLTAALLVAACSGKPDPNSFGGRLALEGGEVAKIGKDWERAQAQVAEGRELIEAGEDRIASGEKRVERGQRDIRRGEEEVARGRTLIAQGQQGTAAAEAAYDARLLEASQRVRPGGIPQNQPLQPSTTLPAATPVY